MAARDTIRTQPAPRTPSSGADRGEMVGRRQPRSERLVARVDHHLLLSLPYTFRRREALDLTVIEQNAERRLIPGSTYQLRGTSQWRRQRQQATLIPARISTTEVPNRVAADLYDDRVTVKGIGRLGNQDGLTEATTLSDASQRGLVLRLPDDSQVAMARPVLRLAEAKQRTEPCEHAEILRQPGRPFLRVRTANEF